MGEFVLHVRRLSSSCTSQSSPLPPPSSPSSLYRHYFPIKPNRSQSLSIISGLRHHVMLFSFFSLERNTSSLFPQKNRQTDYIRKAWANIHECAFFYVRNPMAPPCRCFVWHRVSDMISAMFALNTYTDFAYKWGGWIFWPLQYVK